MAPKKSTPATSSTALTAVESEIEQLRNFDEIADSAVSGAVDSILEGLALDDVKYLAATRFRRVAAAFCGVRLLALKKRKGHGEWERFYAEQIERPLGIPLRRGQLYMAQARKLQRVLSQQITSTSGLPMGDLEALLRSLDEEPPKKPAPVSKNEFLTPPRLLKAARRYSVKINCDPCAAAARPRHIEEATCIYTAEENGLAVGNGWEGVAWIAPGIQTDLDAWSAKAFESVDAGDLETAFLCLPIAAVAAVPRLMQLPVAYLNVVHPLGVQDRVEQKKPLPVRMGVFLLAAAPDIRRFAEAFSEEAIVHAPVTPSSSSATPDVQVDICPHGKNEEGSAFAIPNAHEER